MGITEFYEEMLTLGMNVRLPKDMVYEKCDFISLFSQLEVSEQEEYFRRFDESLEKLRLELSNRKKPARRSKRSVDPGSIISTLLRKSILSRLQRKLVRNR